MADPFSSRLHSRHPSLRDHYKLPPDVFYPLVEGFLQDERYTEWSVGYKPWQLHCFGSPGCGKTTFAAIVVENLKRRYRDTDIRVSSVFIQEPVTRGHGAFVEDLLASVYSQLAAKADLENHTPVLPDEYLDACSNGLTYMERVDIIRRNLQSLLQIHKHNFLVLDGLDNLDGVARLLLDYELKESHLRNLSLLITRRIPASQKPKDIITCDHCMKTNLELYWECQDCSEDDSPENGPPQFCNDCREEGVWCEQEGHSMTLEEPYSRVDMDISKPYMQINSFVEKAFDTPLDRFIEREVCNQAGLMNITVDGSENVDVSLPGYIADITEFISKKSEGNINIAKLRLDELSNEQSSVGSAKVSDRLPRSVISFLDSEIAALKDQNPSMCDLALAAIAAVAVHGNGGSIFVDQLEQRTRTIRTNNPIRSLEDILCAANGLLVMQPYDLETFVACYGQDLVLYVQEDYNEALYKAKTMLDEIEEDTDLAEGLEWHMADMKLSPNMCNEPFESTEIDCAGVRTGTDSGYGSANTSRQTTTNSNFPTLNTVKLDNLAQGIGIHFGDSQCSEGEEDSGDLHETTQGDEVVNATSTEAGVCPFCEEQILRSEALHGLHHRSLDALKEAVTGSCAFCRDLYPDILRSHKESPILTDEVDWPRYRFTVRTTGRIGNGRPSVTVTFRPLHEDMGNPQTHKVRTYHLLTEKDIGTIPAAANLGKSTNPEQNISGGAQLRKWIETCNNSHPNCYKGQGGSFVPTRLVDLRYKEAMVRIVHNSTLASNTRYGTLSHSWGPPDFLVLTRKNEDRLIGPGVRIDELSKNFQEAIAVARFIGLDYVWIDSLCIIQGENGDFHHEGMQMHKVYRYSFCNIAIADSANSKGGIFRKRNPNDILPAAYVSNRQGKLDEGTWRILSGDIWKEELLGTKIYTRGWVFQERMLSPRILHFAANQVFWDCSTLSACETLPEGLPHALDALASTDRHWRGRIQASTSASSPKFDSGREEVLEVVGANDGSLETFWQTALQNYTSCALTNQGDKTVAIWSIAKIVRDVLHEEYAGGMWELALEEQLAWRVRDVGRDNNRIPELQYRNPSWTWASVTGTVVPHGRLATRCYTVTGLNGEEGVRLKVKEYCDRDSEPQLASPTLDMAGYMAKGRVKPPNSNTGEYKFEFVTGTGRKYEGGGSFDLYLDEQIPSEHCGATFEMDLVVLAASCLTRGGIPVENDDEKEDEDEDISLRTYTGTALLLVSHKTYASRQYESYQKLLQEVVSPQRLVPDPSYRTGKKSVVAQTEDMRRLVQVLTSIEKRELNGGLGIGKCYRRAGVVMFQGVEREIWQSIKAGGRVEIRLD